jgi:hypothetical protein
VQAERPSRQGRCLGYGLINAGRRGRGYGEREAAQWLDRIHAPGTVGEYDIRVVQPDSTGPRPMTQSPANSLTATPAWSPNGLVLPLERRKLNPAAAGRR